MERALAQYFVSHWSYCGMGSQYVKHHEVSTSQRCWKLEQQSLKVRRVVRRLQQINWKFRECTCLDFSEVITSPHAVYYVDPPYWVWGEFFYKQKMHRRDHQRLAKSLHSVGNWVLSYDDVPQIREWYKDCWIDSYEVYSLRNKLVKGELCIVRNSF